MRRVWTSRRAARLQIGRDAGAPAGARVNDLMQLTLLNSFINSPPSPHFSRQAPGQHLVAVRCQHGIYAQPLPRPSPGVGLTPHLLDPYSQDIMQCCH